MDCDKNKRNKKELTCFISANKYLSNELCIRDIVFVQFPCVIFLRVPFVVIVCKKRAEWHSIWWTPPQHPGTWFMVGDFGIRITKHDAYNWILNTRCKCEHFHVNSFLGSNWKRWNRMRLHEITVYCICRITASALTNEEKKFFIRNNFAGNTFEVGILWKLFPTVLLSDTN